MKFDFYRVRAGKFVFRYWRNGSFYSCELVNEADVAAHRDTLVRLGYASR